MNYIFAVSDFQAEAFGGEYNDTTQHFPLYFREIFAVGLKGIYEKAKEISEKAQTEKEKQFLRAVCEGLLCVKKVSGKFADKAEELLKSSPENENLRRISVSARRCPWEKTADLYEALNTYAFMRKSTRKNIPI